MITIRALFGVCPYVKALGAMSLITPIYGILMFSFSEISSRYFSKDLGRLSGSNHSIVKSHLNCKSMIKGPIRNPINVIIAEIISKVLPRNTPSKINERVISVNETNPYNAQNVSVDDKTRFGSLLIYLVAVCVVSAHSS